MTKISQLTCRPGVSRSWLWLDVDWVAVVCSGDRSPGNGLQGEGRVLCGSLWRRGHGCGDGVVTVGHQAARVARVGLHWAVGWWIGRTSESGLND